MTKPIEPPTTGTGANGHRPDTDPLTERFLYVTLTRGHRHEAIKSEELIEHATGKACIADSGYDAERIREAVRARGRKLYGLRYMVECGFHALKRFRAVATRYEKSGTNFLAAVHVACIMLWLNLGQPLVS
jgi:transposase